MPRRLVAASLLFVVLAACTSTPSRSSDKPIPGGTLRVTVRDLASLDPAKAGGPGAQAAVAQLFDPLTAIDPVTRKVIPAAASSWRVSKDGLRWRFTIAIAPYSDGSPVLAADFKFAFDRIARKSTGSDAAFQLEQVRGFQEAHVAGTANGLSGVTAPLPRVLLIDLQRPFAELPYVLSHPRLAPLPARRFARSDQGIDRAPVGNGPFRTVDFKLGKSAVLTRNERYAGRSPYLNGIEFTVASSVDDGWRSFLSKATDVAEVPLTSIESARTSFGGGGLTSQWATLSFGPNLALNKYTKPGVRRAMSLAIDREAIARTIYGGIDLPATGILPPGMRGFREGACSTCVLDRIRARALIKAAFGNKPPGIVIDHLSESSSRAVARAVAAGLDAIGLKTTLHPHSLAAYRTLLAKGKQDLAQLGWLSDVPVPDGFLAQQLRSGSVDNQTGYKDTLFDFRIDRARAEKRDDVRLQLYAQAERRALDQMPLIPVIFFRNKTAVAPNVRGFTLDGAGIFDGTTVWFASR